MARSVNATDHDSVDAAALGSTTAAGRVMFNIDLVKVPLGCVDYVVAHELAHLAIPNHGPAFWRMLTRCLPEWKKWRDRLGRVEI